MTVIQIFFPKFGLINICGQRCNFVKKLCWINFWLAMSTIALEKFDWVEELPPITIFLTKAFCVSQVLVATMIPSIAQANQLQLLAQWCSSIGEGACCLSFLVFVSKAFWFFSFHCYFNNHVENNCATMSCIIVPVKQTCPKKPDRRNFFASFHCALQLSADFFDVVSPFLDCDTDSFSALSDSHLFAVLASFLQWNQQTHNVLSCFWFSNWVPMKGSAATHKTGARARTKGVKVRGKRKKCSLGSCWTTI